MTDLLLLERAVRAVMHESPVYARIMRDQTSMWQMEMAIAAVRRRYREMSKALAAWWAASSDAEAEAAEDAMDKLGLFGACHQFS